MKLTRTQIDDFNREGWLFLPELFSPEEVALLAREAEGIYDTDRPEVWREKPGAPRTAFAAHLYNEAFGLLGAPSAHDRAGASRSSASRSTCTSTRSTQNRPSPATSGSGTRITEPEPLRRHAGTAGDEHRDLSRRGDADQRSPDAGAEEPECRRPQGGA